MTLKTSWFNAGVYKNAHCQKRQKSYCWYRNRNMVSVDKGRDQIMKPSFDLNAVKSIIGTHDDLWRWEEAKACYDPEFVKLFSYDYLLSVNDLVCFDSKHLKSSAKAMEAIKNEPVVFALAWYYYYVLYIRAEFDMHQSNPYIPIPRLKTGNAVIDNSFGFIEKE